MGKCCSIVFASAQDPHVSATTGTGPSETAYQCYKLGGNLMLSIGSVSYETAGNQFCKTAHTAADATNTAYTINTAGTITSCSCVSRVSATIFTIGFSLLAILASLWK